MLLTCILLITHVFNGEKDATVIRYYHSILAFESDIGIRVYCV